MRCCSAGWSRSTARSASVTDGVLDVCLHHHERVDGKGYPHGLRGEQISPLAKMGAVCDVYDAITSNRPYKAAWDPSESIGKMASWRDGHFDEAIFQAFVRSLGIYPIGSLVRMASDRLGVVIEQNARLDHPAEGQDLLLGAAPRLPISLEVVDLASAACNDRIAGRESNSVWKFPHLDSLWAEHRRAAQARPRLSARRSPASVAAGAATLRGSARRATVRRFRCTQTCGRPAAIRDHRQPGPSTGCAQVTAFRSRRPAWRPCRRSAGRRSLLGGAWPPASAQTLRWASQGDPQTMDPHSQNELLTNSMNGQVYETLVNRNRKLDLEPVLATEWQQTSPLVWRFKLRPNVKFHDGSAVQRRRRRLLGAARARGHVRHQAVFACARRAEEDRSADGRIHA